METTWSDSGRPTDTSYFIMLHWWSYYASTNTIQLDTVEPLIIRRLKGQAWVSVSWKWLCYMVKGYMNSRFFLWLSELFVVKMSPPWNFLPLYILTLTSALFKVQGSFISHYLVSLKRIDRPLFNKRTWWISKIPVMSHEPHICHGRIRLELHVHVAAGRIDWWRKTTTTAFWQTSWGIVASIEQFYTIIVTPRIIFQFKCCKVEEHFASIGSNKEPLTILVVIVTVRISRTVDWATWSVVQINNFKSTTCWPCQPNNH